MKHKRIRLMAPKGFSSENLLFRCSIETSSLFIQRNNSISSFTDQTGSQKKACLQFCIELKAVRSWDLFLFFKTAAQCSAEVTHRVYIHINVNISNCTSI